MKKLSIFTAAALMLAAVSCNKEAAPIAEPEQGTPAVQKITFTAYADNGADTRTILDGNDIKWAAGETIYVFDGTAPRAFTSTNTEEAAIVTFEGEAAEAETYTAVFPAATMTGSTINATIPVYQTATAGSFDPKSNVAVAVSGTDPNDPTLLQFKNAGAVVKFQLTDTDIAKVRLDAIGGEKLAGKAAITLNSENLPVVAMSSDAESCVILKPSTGNFAASTTYAIAIAPGTYAQGFKLTLFKADGKFKSFSNKNTQTLARNSMMDFGTIPAVATWKETKKDVLTRETTGVVSGSQDYTEWTATGVSGAVYSGLSAGNYDSIQLRTKNNNSGIVITSSNGLVGRVSVEWDDNTMGTRSIEVFGKSTAYDEAADLYDETKCGTSLGVINCGDETPLELSGNYAFIGIRSTDGAVYLSSITIEWAGSGSAPIDPVVAPNTFSVEEPESNVIPAAGGSSSFTITSSVPWTISLDDESAATYQLTSNGNVTTVEVTMNSISSGSRNVTFTIISSEGETKEVSFKQSFASAILLTFPDDNSDNNTVNNYTSTWTAQTGDYSFTIKNFNNNNWGWTFIKCGSKNFASTGSIQTQKIEFAVSEIVVTVDSYNNSAKATTKLEVASDANFSTLVATVNVTMASGNLTYSVPTDKQAANLYYRVSYACEKSTSNGAIQISKVVVKP